MITGKIEKILNEEINYSCDDGFARVNIIGAEYAAERIVNLLTPKLQWKSQEITNNGGSNLVASIYSLKNYHCSIQIYDHVDKLAQVHWNHRASFTGSLEECKKFCSDKILNDFLKLCE